MNETKKYRIINEEEIEKELKSYKKIPINICLCWLSECDCQFQRHRKMFTLCESLEIWKLCVKKEPLNCGDDD